MLLFFCIYLYIYIFFFNKILFFYFINLDNDLFSTFEKSSKYFGNKKGVRKYLYFYVFWHFIIYSYILLYNFLYHFNLIFIPLNFNELYYFLVIILFLNFLFFSIFRLKIIQHIDFNYLLAYFFIFCLNFLIFFFYNYCLICLFLIIFFFEFFNILVFGRLQLKNKYVDTFYIKKKKNI